MYAWQPPKSDKNVFDNKIFFIRQFSLKTASLSENINKEESFLHWSSSLEKIIGQKQDAFFCPERLYCYAAWDVESFRATQSGTRQKNCLLLSDFPGALPPAPGSSTLKRHGAVRVGLRKGHKEIWSNRVPLLGGNVERDGAVPGEVSRRS